MNTEVLKKIIESTSSDLAIIDTSFDLFLDQFRRARRAYFLNDLEGLKKGLEYFQTQSFEEARLCREIFKTRILIREKSTPADVASGIVSKAETKIEPLIELNVEFKNEASDSCQLLWVELMAVQAIWCDLTGLQELSVEKNRAASLRAEKLGMKKKSSTLLYNAIVAINHQAPAQLRICNLTDAINKAELCEDHNTVIAALTSLAQEYEALGCLNLAYEESAKAMALAKKHCFGSFNFCAVLLQGINLSAQIGNLEIALENLKLVEAFNFDELKEEVIKTKDLIDSKESAEILSGDEQKLIQLLTTSPKDKYFLIDRLYGMGDQESLDNRLKQLFLRLRKKRKGLVSYNKKNCLYELMH